jgi:hypothetical protein
VTIRWDINIDDNIDGEAEFRWESFVTPDLGDDKIPG